MPSFYFEIDLNKTNIKLITDINFNLEIKYF